MITVRKAAADSPEAVQLMRELSAILLSVTGRSGEAGFRAEDMDHPGAAFAVAFMDDGGPVGCGAIREFAPGYRGTQAHVRAGGAGRGVGKQVLHFLEREAARLGYSPNHPGDGHGQRKGRPLLPRERLLGYATTTENTRAATPPCAFAKLL